MIENTKRVLILGASGMLGNAVMRVFMHSPGFDALGAVRSPAVQKHVSREIFDKLIVGHDLENHDQLAALFQLVRPEYVINCVGLVKQLEHASDPLQAIPINSLLPHRLARLCSLVGARLIQISTDCVFSGMQGNYSEMSRPDANDIYGRSKLLGEVDYLNAITLRTSIIGHELSGQRSLINWFLSQETKVKGYTNAIFSGLPTVELAHIIRDFVIPNPELRGLYHVSAAPISKYDLLLLVAKVYSKSIQVMPDESLIIDRSLDSARFREVTGYIPTEWPALIKKMHQFK